jgi:hypothetical protein
MNCNIASPLAPFLGGEGLKALLAKFLQKTQEFQMLNFTIQG